MLALITVTLGCAIEDGTAFGAPYQIASSPEPQLMADGHISFTATYASSCADEDDKSVAFEVERWGEDKEVDETVPAIMRQSVMLVGKRTEDPSVCRRPRPFPMDVTVAVRAPVSCSAELFKNAKTTFLVCPPGSHFEMMKVDIRSGLAGASGSGGKPSFLRQVPVLSATRPADWDEEEDGEWQPPPQQHVDATANASRETDDEAATAGSSAASGVASGSAASAAATAGVASL